MGWLGQQVSGQPHLVVQTKRHLERKSELRSTIENRICNNLHQTLQFSLAKTFLQRMHNMTFTVTSKFKFFDCWLLIYLPKNILLHFFLIKLFQTNQCQSFMEHEKICIYFFIFCKSYSSYYTCVVGESIECKSNT